MEDWKIFKLSELVSLLGDGIHGTPKYTENGEYYFLNGNNLVDGSILIKPDTKRVSKDEYLKHKRNLNDRTLLVSINGTIGKVAYYKGEKVMLGKSACYFNVKNDVSKEFIKQVISSKYFIDYLESNFTGSVIKNISLKSMRDFPVNLPPLEEQKSIASILSALDDKIALNLQMNKTLEEMAMALYKHWFVDFGPFQNGNFVDSELGMIPEGWEVKTLSELGNIFYGKMPKKDKLQSNGFPVFSGYNNVGFYPEYNCKIGKVIVVARGVGGTGDVKITSENCFLTNLSICINNDFNLIDDAILYYGLKRNNLHYLRTGSAQPQITIGDLNGVIVLLPNKSIQVDFLKIFRPIIEKIKFNTTENQTLTTLRDTLLPKLISGEVRVKDAEQILAAAL